MTGGISFALLLIVGILCGHAVLIDLTKKNIFETLGYSLIGIWALARLPEKFMTLHTEPIHMILHVGLFLLVGGTWLRHWREGHHELRQQ
jgi:hypothetical protein